jgi:hypothetical protein
LGLQMSSKLDEKRAEQWGQWEVSHLWGEGWVSGKTGAHWDHVR